MAIDFDRWVRVRWETDRRYYEALLHQDLFGGWVLTRIWGGRWSAQGKVVDTPCKTIGEGLILLRQVRRQRKNRGYAVVTDTDNGQSGLE